MASASPPCAAPNSTSAFVAPKTENQVPGGGLCRLRRISTLRLTRQDAQINYLSTLTIFMKQTTYLATLPKVNALIEQGLEPASDTRPTEQPDFVPPSLLTKGDGDRRLGLRRSK